jgi:kynurenine 3-monooxygenase
VRGRVVHSGQGPVSFIPYGKDDQEVIYSFSRTALNSLLLDHAERQDGIRLHFHEKCVDLDKGTAAAVFQNDRTGQTTRVEAEVLMGADGAFSTVRQRLQRGERADYRQDFLAWGYKELTFVAGPGGCHQMEKHGLHIWPCGDHMLFALPNLDGSFSGVCILPFQGKNSFASIRSDEDVLALFRAHFGDALPLIPDLLTEFATHRVCEFLTLRTSQWHYKGKVVLLGDAAHSVVPFYGQGMNAAFEDCSVLAGCIDRHPGAWETAFAEYQALRKPNTDVLGDLSIENFHELRDTVRRPIVEARKRTSIFLNRLFAQHSIPLYTMVSHSTLPYADCLARARRQDRIARWLGLDLVVGAVTLWVQLRTAIARRRARREVRRKQSRWRAAALSLRGDEPAGS